MVSALKHVPSSEDLKASHLPDWRLAVGLQKSQTELTQLLDSKFAHPVILLFSPKGYGKRHLALWMAAKHLCETSSACGTCGECREVIAGIHPDLLVVQELEDATIKSAALEELQDHLNILSPRGLRVAVIANCDRMSPEAANRMLKTLEEPPEQARFILTTSRPKALLPTVLGRSLKWRVSPPRLSEVLPWFQDLLKQHGRASEDNQTLVTWLRRAGNSPGVLVRQLEDQDDVAAASADRIKSLLEAARPQDVLRMAEDLARSSRLKMTDFLEAHEWELNDIYRAGQCKDGPRVIAARRSLVNRLRRLSGFGRIHLNSQLAAESIGLLPFGERVGDLEWHI